LDLAIDDKIIEKSGAWVNYGDMRLGQGRENAKQFLRDNPQLLEEISRKVMAKRLKANAMATAPEAPAKPEPAPAKRAEAAAPPKKGPAKAEA
jgi:recombination protein RecA